MVDRWCWCIRQVLCQVLGIVGIPMMMCNRMSSDLWMASGGRQKQSEGIIGEEVSQRGWRDDGSMRWFGIKRAFMTRAVTCGHMRSRAGFM